MSPPGTHPAGTGTRRSPHAHPNCPLHRVTPTVATSAAPMPLGPPHAYPSPLSHATILVSVGNTCARGFALVRQDRSGPRCVADNNDPDRLAGPGPRTSGQAGTADRRCLTPRTPTPPHRHRLPSTRATAEIERAIAARIPGRAEVLRFGRDIPYPRPHVLSDESTPLDRDRLTLRPGRSKQACIVVDAAPPSPSTSSTARASSTAAPSPRPRHDGPASTNTPPNSPRRRPRSVGPPLRPARKPDEIEDGTLRPRPFGKDTARPSPLGVVSSARGLT